MNIIENNRILAEFIGYNKEEVNGEVYFTHNEMIESLSDEELKFHKDWNCLIEVVEKIKKENGILPTPEGNLPNTEDWEGNNFGATNIEQAYQDCIIFIKNHYGNN
jgi:hypothetical protein